MTNLVETLARASMGDSTQKVYGQKWRIRCYARAAQGKSLWLLEKDGMDAAVIALTELMALRCFTFKNQSLVHDRRWRGKGSFAVRFALGENRWHQAISGTRGYECPHTESGKMDILSVYRIRQSRWRRGIIRFSSVNAVGGKKEVEKER